MIKVYGVPGWGSTMSELMLTLADIPYKFVDVSGIELFSPPISPIFFRPI